MGTTGSGETSSSELLKEQREAVYKTSLSSQVSTSQQGGEHKQGASIHSTYDSLSSRHPHVSDTRMSFGIPHTRSVSGTVSEDEPIHGGQFSGLSEKRYQTRSRTPVDDKSQTPSSAMASEDSYLRSHGLDCDRRALKAAHARQHPRSGEASLSLPLPPATAPVEGAHSHMRTPVYSLSEYDSSSVRVRGDSAAQSRRVSGSPSSSESGGSGPQRGKLLMDDPSQLVPEYPRHATSSNLSESSLCSWFDFLSFLDVSRMTCVSPVALLSLVTCSVAVCTVVLYRTGWRQYNSSNHRVYFRHSWAFVLQSSFVLVHLLFVVVLPWHLFTHRPVTGPFRTRLLMLVMGVPWMLCILVGRVVPSIPQNAARSAGDAWLMLNMLVTAPLLFPHPPLRSTTYFVAAVPSVLMWILCDALWFNNPFGRSFTDDGSTPEGEALFEEGSKKHRHTILGASFGAVATLRIVCSCVLLLSLLWVLLRIGFDKYYRRNFSGYCYGGGQREQATPRKRMSLLPSIASRLRKGTDGSDEEGDVDVSVTGNGFGSVASSEGECCSPRCVCVHVVDLAALYGSCCYCCGSLHRRTRSLRSRTRETIEHDVGYMVLFVFFIVVGPCAIFGTFPKICYQVIPSEFSNASLNPPKLLGWSVAHSEWISIPLFALTAVVCAAFESITRKLCQYSLSVDDHFVFCYPVILATNMVQMYMLLVVPINSWQWYVIAGLYLVFDFCQVSQFPRFAFFHCRYVVRPACLASLSRRCGGEREGGSIETETESGRDASPILNPSQMHTDREDSDSSVGPRDLVVGDEVSTSTSESHSPSRSPRLSLASMASSSVGVHGRHAGNLYREEYEDGFALLKGVSPESEKEMKIGFPRDSDFGVRPRSLSSVVSPSAQLAKDEHGWTAYDHCFAYALWKTVCRYRPVMLAQTQAKVLVVVVVLCEVVCDALSQVCRREWGVDLHMERNTWTVAMPGLKRRVDYLVAVFTLCAVSVLTQFGSRRFVDRLTSAMRGGPSLVAVPAVYGLQFAPVMDNSLGFTEEIKEHWQRRDSNYFRENLPFLVTVTNFLVSFGFAFFIPVNGDD